MVIYKGNDLKRQARWMSTMPYKEDRDRAILHDLHAYPQPVFEGEIIRYAKNNNHLDTFVEKKDFFMEKLSPTTKLMKLNYLTISFEDCHHFIQEKPKSTETSGLPDQVQPLLCWKAYKTRFS